MDVGVQESDINSCKWGRGEDQGRKILWFKIIVKLYTSKNKIKDKSLAYTSQWNFCNWLTDGRSTLIAAKIKFI